MLLRNNNKKCLHELCVLEVSTSLPRLSKSVSAASWFVTPLSSANNITALTPSKTTSVNCHAHWVSLFRFASSFWNHGCSCGCGYSLPRSLSAPADGVPGLSQLGSHWTSRIWSVYTSGLFRDSARSYPIPKFDVLCAQAFAGCWISRHCEVLRDWSIPRQISATNASGSFSVLVRNTAADPRDPTVRQAKLILTSGSVLPRDVRRRSSCSNRCQSLSHFAA